jgi:hypothetical protein
LPLASVLNGWLTNWRNRRGLAQPRESETALIPCGQFLQTKRDQHRRKRQGAQQPHIALALHSLLGQSTSGYIVPKTDLMSSIHRNRAFPSSSGYEVVLGEAVGEEGGGHVFSADAFVFEALVDGFSSDSRMVACLASMAKTERSMEVTRRWL